MGAAGRAEAKGSKMESPLPDRLLLTVTPGKPLFPNGVLP
jgi:hypothetical protein